MRKIRKAAQIDARTEPPKFSPSKIGCVEPNRTNSIGAATHAAIHQSSQTLKPEWIRVPEAVRVFSLCRSSLYELIAAGKIKSTCLRKRGAVRGIRLISYDSLAAYVDQAVRAGGITE